MEENNLVEKNVKDVKGVYVDIYAVLVYANATILHMHYMHVNVMCIPCVLCCSLEMTISLQEPSIFSYLLLTTQEIHFCFISMNT